MARHCVTGRSGLALPDEFEHQFMLADDLCASRAGLEIHQLPHQQSLIVLRVFDGSGGVHQSGIL